MSYESIIYDWIWTGIFKMDNKQSMVILGASISVAVIVAAYLLVASDGMSPYEPYATGFEHNFGGGENQTFNENWCIDNKGHWEPVGTDCHFQTEEDLIRADVIFDKSSRIKITGQTAKNVCAILEIPCPENATFDAWFNTNGWYSKFDYTKGEKIYDFVIRGDDIEYKISEDGGSNWSSSAVHPVL